MNAFLYTDTCMDIMVRTHMHTDIHTDRPGRDRLVDRHGDRQTEHIFSSFRFESFQKEIMYK